MSTLVLGMCSSGVTQLVIPILPALELVLVLSLSPRNTTTIFKPFPLPSVKLSLPKLLLMFSLATTAHLLTVIDTTVMHTPSVDTGTPNIITNASSI